MSYLEQQILINTYKQLKSSGGIQDYRDYDIAQSSFDQRRFMQTLPNSSFLIPKNAANVLIEIHNHTELHQKEFPFFIFAHDGRNSGNQNQIIVDEIVYDPSSLSTQKGELAEYKGELLRIFNEKITNHKNDPGFIVIQGHSHPSFRGDIGNMYSVQDLSNLVYLNKLTGIQFGACVITPDHKANICFYDNYYNNFYKVTNFQITPSKQTAVNKIKNNLR